MVITFDKPPLVEVALGRVFLQRQDFLVPHFGSFWELVKADFPKVAHATPISQSPESVVVSDEGYWLPRVWLSSPDDVFLIQLQQDRFHVNWRKTTANPEYVRFPAILKRYQALWALFEAFVAEVTGAPLQPVMNEMVYTNFIAEEGMEIFGLSQSALRDSVWFEGGRLLPQPKALSHNYSFEMPNQLGELTVSIASGRRAADGSAILKVDLQARGAASDRASQDFETWAVEARHFLVAAFKDLTTDKMHKKWELRNDG